MSDEDRLTELLQSALPKTSDEGPSRDLWPLVANRIQSSDRWGWFDLSLAAAAAIVLLIFPEWLLLLLYHL
jgi:hypothetical protein